MKHYLAETHVTSSQLHQTQARQNKQQTMIKQSNLTMNHLTELNMFLNHELISE